MSQRKGFGGDRTNGRAGKSANYHNFAQEIRNEVRHRMDLRVLLLIRLVSPRLALSRPFFLSSLSPLRALFPAGTKGNQWISGCIIEFIIPTSDKSNTEKRKLLVKSGRSGVHR